jgi:hypothetical protein
MANTTNGTAKGGKRISVQDVMDHISATNSEGTKKVIEHSTTLADKAESKAKARHEEVTVLLTKNNSDMARFAESTAKANAAHEVASQERHKTMMSKFGQAFDGIGKALAHQTADAQKGRQAAEAAAARRHQEAEEAADRRHQEAEEAAQRRHSETNSKLDDISADVRALNNSGPRWNWPVAMIIAVVVAVITYILVWWLTGRYGTPVEIPAVDELGNTLDTTVRAFKLAMTNSERIFASLASALALGFATIGVEMGAGVPRCNDTEEV